MYSSYDTFIFSLQRIYAIYMYNTLQRIHQESALQNKFTELALAILGCRLFHKVIQLQ